MIFVCVYMGVPVSTPDVGKLKRTLICLPKFCDIPMSILTIIPMIFLYIRAWYVHARVRLYMNENPVICS
jgi:hypothetical protein